MGSSHILSKSWTKLHRTLQNPSLKILMVLDGLIRAMRQKSHCQLRLSCCSMIYVICSYNVNGSQLTYSGVIMCTVSKGVKRSSGWFEHQQPDGMSVHVLLRFHFSKKRSLAPQPRSHTHNTLVLSHIDTKQYFFFFYFWQFFELEKCEAPHLFIKTEMYLFSLVCINRCMTERGSWISVEKLLKKEKNLQIAETDMQQLLLSRFQSPEQTPICSQCSSARNCGEEKSKQSCLQSVSEVYIKWLSLA